MLKNYFKIAIAVLRRRKFFTFISLFGISFTLAILMVATAFIDKVINDKYPDKKRHRLLYVHKFSKVGKNSMNSNKLSFHFIDHYIGSLNTPVKVAISSDYNATNTYVNNKKIVINYKYTNADYWSVLDYDFLEGKPFTLQQVNNGERVTVISEDIKREYFGDTGPVVGKYLEANNERFRISGVVKNVPVTTFQMYSDIYLPYTLSKTDYRYKSYIGDYMAILLAGSKNDIPKMQKEYADMVNKLPIEGAEFDKMYSSADPYLQSFVNTGNQNRSGMAIAISALSVFLLIIMLLPTLNLVNINITRIMERSSEIGVRKAFGASSKTLVYQFLIENLILTLLGGIIGVVLSLIALSLINNADLIANLDLSINITVLFYALIITLVFGLLSGVYPAWRMSKLNVVSALKSQ
jgi:putative ABC transport system permease protein